MQLLKLLNNCHMSRNYRDYPKNCPNLVLTHGTDAGRKTFQKLCSKGQLEDMQKANLSIASEA